MNLTTRVVVTFALVIGVALLTASLLIGRAANVAYRGYLSGYERQRLAEVAEGAGQRYAASGSWVVVQEWLDEVASLQPAPGLRGGRGPGGGRGAVERYVVVDAASGMALADGALPAVAATVLELGVPLGGDGGAVVVAIGAAAGLGPAEQSLLNQVNRAILASALAAGALALLLGSLLVASILRPLRQLETTVAQVAQGELQARAQVQGGGEIGQLATSFNSMAARLQEQEALRRRLMADIAHELRTPLSVLQGNLQAILDGVYPLALAEIDAVHEETRLLSRLVDDLHDLAQAEAGQLALARQTLVAADVVTSLAGAFRALARSKGLTVAVDDVDPALTVNADPDRLQQMLHNLLGNALRHTAAGGTIRLGARAAGGGRVRLWVRDTGPGIAAEDLPFLFERFYRADASRERGAPFTGNAGLGLAIVRALARAHGGGAGVESEVGVGSTFWVELPVGV